MIRISEDDLHLHLKARMYQRGVLLEEIEMALNEGWEAKDSKPGTLGKVLVFSYNNLWEGKFFNAKEVTVYYKLVDNKTVLLTVKARYGENFSTGGEKNEIRI